MIDLTIHRQALDRNIQKAREGGVVIPTFENMKHPETVPEPIRARLRGVGPVSYTHLTLPTICRV